MEVSQKSIFDRLFPAYGDELSREVKQNLDNSFRKTDAFMLRLLMIHWFVASTVTAFTYNTYLLGFLGGGVIVGLAYAVSRMNPGSLLSRITMGASFMAFSMIFIQQHMGRIEMHFHIFIAIAFLIQYKDIAPVLAATVTTAIHHAVFNLAQDLELAVAGTPIMIFDYGCGWDLVALHAVFVIVEMVVISNIVLNLTREYLNNSEVFNIIDDLSSSAYYTTQAADFISNAGQELAINATDNAEAVDKSNKSIDNMNQTILNLNDKTTSVKQKVAEISEDTEHMNRSMNNLKESSNNISTISETIDDIASQTNILALNAAVEAARAGEAGAGFAVVTDEIRVLAQKTATAANDISDMIAANIKKAEEGVDVSERISTQISNLTSWIEGVNSLSDEQISQLNELEVSISKISKTTDSTADMAEKNASTAEELQGQIHTLTTAIEDINRKIDFSTESGPSSDKPSGVQVPEDSWEQDMPVSKEISSLNSNGH